MKIKYRLLIIISITGFSLLAQETRNPKLPRVATRVNVAIPKIVSSQAFRHSFSGVMTIDATVTCKVFSDFFVGGGYAYTYYKPQKYFLDQRVTTNMQAHNGYFKLGYDKFISENSFVTISLNAGYNFNRYEGIVYKHDSLRGKYPTEFASSFVEPMIGVYFIVDPNFALGAHLSYNYNFSQFSPQYSGFDKWLSYEKLNNKWNMSMITLGFGFYYGLAKK